ncbi:LOW QUALITY PROTEIN: centrosomal protein of 70 kDa-like [Pecten maximus]|uniref:LOW QUALITY PROTEIN: centrosomal protein of 70 kDa-like n=1 Tax=Pecten maximus TaxID=6579 RepID=UPI0014583163|nr:LOW QUALITY PROTEIN: centrosomal protein of 70 kDa-like [Pecten maximus]
MADIGSRSPLRWGSQKDWRSQPDDLSDTGYQNEVEEWVELNRKLKQSGLPGIKLLHPADVTLLAGRTISLDTQMSKVVRENITSLMGDCDHRQTLIQDLILTNNKLKDDVEKQTSLAEKYHSRMKELKILLESSRTRVQELEQDEDMKSSFYVDEEEKMLNTKNAIHAKCKHLQHKCQTQEREIERLKQKMQRMAEEEDKRTSRQSQIFQEFKKRTSRAHNTMDDKLLDVIDSYEQQIQGLQKELDFYRSGVSMAPQESEDENPFQSLTSGTSQNLKALIKSYEKQLKDANKKIKKMEDEKELAKLDLGSRPEVGDYRVAQLRIKKLEKVLAIHSISVPGEKPSKDPYRLKKSYSTKMEDVEYLPLDICRNYLKDITCELEADDLQQVLPCIQKLRDEIDTAQRYEQFCRCVEDISQDQKEREGRRSTSPSRRKNVLSEKRLQENMSTLEGWKQDQEGLEELQISLNKLGERIAPWLKIRLAGTASVPRIISAVDKLVYDDGITIEKDGKERPSRPVLENIVQHFQTLFDVPSVSGVFPRMNEIYTKLGEVHNILNTLKTLLGLDEDTKSTDIVDAVGRLCQSHTTTTSKQLKALLQTEDLEGVIRRLDEHNNFFPAFKEIMNKLMDILDIQRLDQVIPAVRALKLLAS